MFLSLWPVARSTPRTHFVSRVHTHIHFVNMGVTTRARKKVGEKDKDKEDSKANFSVSGMLDLAKELVFSPEKCW